MKNFLIDGTTMWSYCLYYKQHKNMSCCIEKTTNNMISTNQYVQDTHHCGAPPERFPDIKKTKWPPFATKADF